MRRTTLAVSLALALTLSLASAVAGGNANFTFGARQFQDDEFWLEADTQPMFGVTVDFGPAHWPVSLAAGYHFSVKEKDVRGTIGGTSFDGQVTAAVGELSFGVRKTWGSGSARPYVEGGLAAVIAGLDADLDIGSANDSDAGAGAYLQGGLFWRLGSRFNVGLNLRALFGSEIDLSDTFGTEFADGDAGYVAGGLILGWGWPAE